jgi:crossover junction endodeoxyribonuclease RuvC
VRALGIDPGSRVTGWGVVERVGTTVRSVGSGTIRLRQGATMAARLGQLQRACRELLATWSPTALVLERAFVARNVQSAFRLGEVRGVVLALADDAAVPVHEYAPTQVKLAAVGFGGATKDAVGRGVVLRLGLTDVPPSDAADALALALCHLQHAPLAAAIMRASDGRAR